jgi:4-amino-4-deoxy-L-arabinose transferase-like glycosyltransferase
MYIAVVALATACGLFYHLGAPRLWDRDEPRNARCAAEMLERGEWIVPTFNGELRAHKPALLYWLMLGSYHVLGVSEFSARLPSALLGIATTVLTYLLGARLFSRRAGLWGALALATSLSFTLAGRAATPDAALLACVTAALAVYVHVAFPKEHDGGALTMHDAWHWRGLPRRWFGWAAVYAVLGLAMLAKGPVGVVLPVAIIGLFLLLANRQAAGEADGARQSGDAANPSRFGAWLAPFHPEHILTTAFRMRPLLLVAMLALVAGPWYVAVHLKTGGAFTEEFFFKHNLERATSAMEGHRGPVVYYVLAMFVGMFPWSILALPVAVEVRHWLRAGDRWRLGITFALCWAALWIAAFSLVSTKLPSYILPAYPALALLIGAFVDRYLAGAAIAARRWLPWAIGSLGLVGAGLAVALPVAMHKLMPGDEVLGWLGAIPIAAAAAAWWSHRTARPLGTAVSLAAGSLAFCLALFGVAQVRIDRHQVSEDLLAAIGALDEPSGDRPAISGPQEVRAAPPSLAAFRDLEPSFVFYADRMIPTFEDAASADAFLRGDGARYLVLNGESLAELEPLPQGIAVVARRAKFLKSGETLVLGRTSPSTARIATRVRDRAN